MTSPHPTTHMTTKKTKTSTEIIRESKSQLPLIKTNFMIMAIAGLMIIVGFILMIGAPSTTDEFNPDIFSTRRIVIGPMITFLGFVLMGLGIIINPARHLKSKKTTDNDITQLASADK